MKKALLVGINDYTFSPLKGCINDVRNMKEVLSRHDDGSLNFSCNTLTSDSATITEGLLSEKLRELFRDPVEAALFYFSGHGMVDSLGGYMVTQDATEYDPGLPFQDIITLIQNSPKISEITIILDCCHSGEIGNWNILDKGDRGLASIGEGVSMITSSRDQQYSVEKGDAGLFTSIIYNALKGGAADVMGNVTIAGIYAYVDQLLSPWEQRPIFKSHVSKMKTIRKCKPKIPFEVLRKLPTYFNSPDHDHKLSPEYEHTSDTPNEKKVKIFKHLQKMVPAGLVRPIGEEHMYDAAMNSKACRLTHLGQFYWRLINEGKI